MLMQLRQAREAEARGDYPLAARLYRYVWRSGKLRERVLQQAKAASERCALRAQDEAAEQDCAACGAPLDEWGVCTARCWRDEPEPEPEEEPEPEGPEDDDVVADDPDGPFYYLRREVARDRGELLAWMERQGWWPNVWWISDHGNAHLIRDLYREDA